VSGPRSPWACAAVTGTRVRRAAVMPTRAARTVDMVVLPSVVETGSSATSRPVDHGLRSPRHAFVSRSRTGQVGTAAPSARDSSRRTLGMEDGMRHHEPAARAERPTIVCTTLVALIGAVAVAIVIGLRIGPRFRTRAPEPVDRGVAHRRHHRRVRRSVAPPHPRRGRSVGVGDARQSAGRGPRRRRPRRRRVRRRRRSTVQHTRAMRSATSS